MNAWQVSAKIQKLSAATFTHKFRLHHQEKTINKAISEELGRVVIRRTRTTLAGLSSGGKLEQGSASDGRVIVEGCKMSF